jgi:uncharacterized protein
MHLTLHVTSRCNFRCRYCYAAPHQGGDMTWETARAAVDLAAELCRRENPDQSVGVIFFGGEPLLMRDLIAQVIRYCREISSHTAQTFHFKVTTNGSLLDESFLAESPTSEVFVALSHDGVSPAHDAQRVDAGGEGTFARLRPAIDLLLRWKPYAPVMLVTTPETVRYYAQSVRFLFECGFRYLICSLNYGVEWPRKAVRELEGQYRELARWYEELLGREEKFYFSPFDTKIASHIFPGSCRSERCELGRRQISVAPTGRLFPCVQFVGDGSDSRFSIGDVQSGIDETRRAALYAENAQEKKSCERCAIRERCNHYCGCLNRQATGSITQVAPLLCAHERIVLDAADRVAERLFRKRNAMFVQKQYNELFPLVSLAEDRSNALAIRRPPS